MAKHYTARGSRNVAKTLAPDPSAHIVLGVDVGTGPSTVGVLGAPQDAAGNWHDYVVCMAPSVCEATLNVDVVTKEFFGFDKITQSMRAMVAEALKVPVALVDDQGSFQASAATVLAHRDRALASHVVAAKLAVVAAIQKVSAVYFGAGLPDFQLEC